MARIHRPEHTPGAASEAPDSQRRAVVVGGGVSGLLAAKDLQAAGWQVAVYDGAPSLGGCVASHEVAGLVLDAGAESFATRSTAVSELAQELGLADRIVTPHPSGAWVWLPEGPVPLPRTGVLGIPSDLQAPEVKAALGSAGVLRAALDATLPAAVGTTEEVMSVAALVRARMGRRVLERLVAPVVGGVHSADPETLDVDMVAPGLRAGIREHGSLAAAVAAQRAGGARPGSAVAGLEGGMHTLVEALVRDVRAAGVALNPGHRITAVGRTSSGGPEGGPGGGAKVSSDDNPDSPAGSPDSPAGSTAGPARWTVDWESGPYRGRDTAEVLVMAVDGPAAVRLLAPEVPDIAPFAPAPGPDIRLVTLVVDVPELDSRPRGTGILVAPQAAGIQAKALTHATAKWQWLADAAGPGTHVLRLSYGRAGVPASEAVRLTRRPEDDAGLIATALADATTLLGVPVTEADVLGADVIRWKGALPFAAVGHQARVAQIHALAGREPGLVLTGGWMTGNGLAAVVAGVRRQVRAVIDAAGAV